MPDSLANQNSQSRKETPIFSGLLMYFPKTCAAVARLSFKANEKHNPGEPMHWSKDKSNDHPDCMVRHAMSPRELDEFGEIHAVAAAWRAFANCETHLEEMEQEEAERLAAQDISDVSEWTTTETEEQLAKANFEQYQKRTMTRLDNPQLATIRIVNPLDMGLGGELAGATFMSTYSPIHDTWRVSTDKHHFYVTHADLAHGYAELV